jgi:hypothetical protein
MSAANTHQNGTVQHWVTVRPEPTGQFTAQAVGLPDVRATCATREEALVHVQKILRALLASGHLVAIDVTSENPLLNWVGADPNDPDEQAYLEALARDKQADLEQTLRELDQECSNSSSTPTI